MELSEALRIGIPSANTPSIEKDHLARDVYSILSYGMGWGDASGRKGAATTGKALRPTLCLFACEAAGGESRQAIPAAVALEYIHNFSLIHDDIQDRDETRHHRPTIWTVWGVPRAIVAGNVLRTLADVILSDSTKGGLSSLDTLVLNDTLTGAYLEMIEGQFLDLSYENRGDISLEEYLDMISRKTGALIRCSLELGAYVGSRDSTTVESFRKCGQALGLVFQIKDDVLGVWGESRNTGKPVGADVRRKKNSFPMVHAMSYALGADAKALEYVYRKDEPDDTDVSIVLDIMERLGTREYAEEMAANHSKAALDALVPVKMTTEVRAQIEGLAEFLLVRDH